MQSIFSLLFISNCVLASNYPADYFADSLSSSLNRYVQTRTIEDCSAVCGLEADCHCFSYEHRSRICQLKVSKSATCSTNARRKMFRKTGRAELAF